MASFSAALRRDGACSILCLMLFEEAFDEIAGSIKVQLQQIGLLRLLFGAIIAHALVDGEFSDPLASQPQSASRIDPGREWSHAQRFSAS